MDRVKMYPGTFVATLPENLYIPAIDLQSPKPVGVLSQLSCVASLLTYPLKRFLSPPKSQQEAMQRFYAGQARAYDTVRESMLPARRALISLMAPFRRNGLTWLDVGGGTGRNVRYLRGQLAHFDKIIIADVCPALLEAGQKSAADVLDECERRRILWLCLDATASDFLTRVHDASGVRMFDRVTFSYSLSMIPDWRAAVRNATALCDGRMIVADFDTFSEDGAGMKDWVLCKWFAQDGVHISAERRRGLSQVLDVSYVRRWVEEGLVRGVGLPHFVLAAEVGMEKAVWKAASGDATREGI